MKKIFLSIFISLTAVCPVGAQTISGTVYDAQTREPLVGAGVYYNLRGESRGTATDVNGYYEMDLPTGGSSVVVSFLGYEDQQLHLILDVNENTVRDIYMNPSVNLLDNVVISAGRFEQKLTDITVSMEVLKSEAINRQSPTDLSAVLNTIPGVDINDKQPSIRGGAGWTYGVGSRALIMVDGMSVLTPDNGEINWNSVPIENIQQVEVIKGASSVLYGSSALNGLINVRTGRPGLVPKTNVKVYSGIYGNPANSENEWWDKNLWTEGKFGVKPILRNTLMSGVRNPIYEGFDFSHTRRIGDFDVSAGVNLFTDEGYRQSGYNKRFNFGGNITYHHPSERNIISYGADMNFLSERYGDFFIWRSPKEAYRSSSFNNMGREGNTFNISPFYQFVNPDNHTSHKIRTRFYYRGDNIVNSYDNVSLIDMLGNMGTDLNSVLDLVNGDLTPIYSLIPPLLQGDLNGVVDGAFDFLGTVFPNATTADYSDMIAWFMNNGIPSGIIGGDYSDVVSWASQAFSNREEKTPVDKFYNYYLDYQFNKKLGDASFTVGTTYEHTRTNSATTGSHMSDNVAVFFQYDQRFFDRLSVSLGVRGEYYRVDEHKREAEAKIFGKNVPFKPVFRGGLNYQLADYTFLRASFGQGYRYPSIIEKYARKDVGGVGVFPNDALKAEKGFNAEIGIKQGYRIGRAQGFFDVAGFYTQYKDMIEFRFGLFDGTHFNYINSVKEFTEMLFGDGSLGIGAQFYNVSKARIYGVEVSTNGFLNIDPSSRMVYNIGYVYTEPIDVDYKKKNQLEATYTDPLEMKEKSNPSKYLKYRQKHSFKATLDYEWKRISVGTNLSWKSRTLAVDYFMVDEREKPGGKYQVMDYVRDILFGNVDGVNLESYWKSMNKSYFLVDLRFGAKATDNVQFQFMINNLLNKEYCTRPMALGAPRTYMMQVGITF